MNNINRKETHNGYDYEVYNNGSVRATGMLQNKKAERNGYIQKTAGGESRQETDHGGHLVPASQNGTSNRINIFAQNAKVNTRDVRAVEREESKAINNGTIINTERIAVCDVDPNRPSAYIINDHVIMLEGSEHDIHHSFTNADMSQFDNDAGLDKAQDSYNIAKEMGYSKKEYEQILTEAENYYSDYDEGWHSSTPTATSEPDSSSNTQSWFQASEDNDESEEHLTDNDSDGYYDFDSDSDSESL